MKKKILIFLITFVFLGVLFYAQEEQQVLEKNFQKAGEEELIKKENDLLQQKTEIEEFFYAMADDAIISNEEMKTLRTMVKEFDEIQKKFNEQLSFYKLRVAIEFSLPVYEILSVYFNQKDSFDYGDNQNQDIRYFFVKLTGKDISVETVKNYKDRIGSGLLFGLFLAFLSLVFVFLTDCSVFFRILVFLVIFIFIMLIFLIF